MTQDLERQLIGLVANDRIEIPISSMSGKLKRQKPKLAKAVSEGFNVRFNGERAYARIEEKNKMKARTMKEGIGVFEKRYPKYGEILRNIISEEREKKEVYMHFGMCEGCRITADDYRDVMTNLGFTATESENLYSRLMDISRKLSRKRDENRSIMIG